MLFRTVKRKIGDSWISCNFEDLLVDDQFELFEPDGSSVAGILVAYSLPAKQGLEGNWGIVCDKVIFDES